MLKLVMWQRLELSFHAASGCTDQIQVRVHMLIVNN
jgi:hypothetical protein